LKSDSQNQTDDKSNEQSEKAKEEVKKEDEKKEKQKKEEQKKEEKNTINNEPSDLIKALKSRRMQLELNKQEMEKKEKVDRKKLVVMWCIYQKLECLSYVHKINSN